MLHQFILILNYHDALFYYYSLSSRSLIPWRVKRESAAAANDDRSFGVSGNNDQNREPTQNRTFTVVDVQAPPGLLGFGLTQRTPDQHVISIARINTTCVMKAQL